MKKFIFVIILLIVILLSIYLVKNVVIDYPNEENGEIQEFETNIENINNQENVQNEVENSLNEAATNTATPTTVPKIAEVPPLLENGFELPIDGATGYTSISMKLYKTNSSSSTVITTLSPGTGFCILKESGNWWYVSVSDKKGWLKHKYCMINLPDVIPSIIYDNTNSYSSIFMSSGNKLPDITGKALYHTYVKNNRLNKKEYIMPIMYHTAKLIAKAQQAALKNDQSLKIYETYRPYQTQKSISTSLSTLIKENEEVDKGINTNGWNESWFIAQVLSNHQRGIALDVSLAKIKKSKQIEIGEYTCLKITKYTECSMPTKMHELSVKAATFKYGVNSQSQTAWKNVPLAKTMTTSAKTLQKYFTDVGMSPLASEWWHFNDLQAKKDIGNNYSTGQYYITKCYSKLPRGCPRIGTRKQKFQ